MANYENGRETKAKIIEACKDLFYYKGFNQTTFKEISEVAGVNQGLIIYYFKNKNVLARTVFQSVMTRLMEQIHEWFPNQENLVRYFISDYLYFRMLYEDENFRRFVETCCSGGILNKDSESSDEGYQKQYDEIIHFMEDDYITDITMRDGLIAVYEGMKDNYSLYICRNHQIMATDVAATNYITLYCHLLDIPKSTYGGKMIQAQLLANQVGVSVYRFDLKMTGRKTVD